GDFAYVAHVGTSPRALSILDVADPENPKLVRQLDHPPNTHNHKVQIVGNTLIQNSETISYIPKSGPEEPVTGINVYNLDDPTDPSMAGGWSLPTDWPALDPKHDHMQVHGAIPFGDRAYVSCTDAGMSILDISDLANPKFISRINWSPPYGGYSHTSLPLPDRGLVVEVCETVNGGREGNGDKRIWLIDVREERQPVMVSSFPTPKPPQGTPWETFDDRPLRF